MPADPGRPGYHFTVPAGWINDPLGVTWHEASDGGRYELFYQSNPEAPVWTPACRWGQATSADLVRWRDPRTALEPGPGEVGCWSGSVVVDQGRPVLVYTSVLAGSTDLGRISLADGDASWRRWVPDPAGPVIAAPRPDQGYAHVRDPFVWRDGDLWRMAVGAGRTDGRPAVLQYSSADLRAWQPDGVLAEPEPGREGPGGAVWECPQLFPLDGAWVLIVSVSGRRTAGCRLRRRRLRRPPLHALGAGSGSRTTRSTPPPRSSTPRAAGARSRGCGTSGAAGPRGRAPVLPWLLALEGDRVTVSPHPDVDSLRAGLR